MLWNPKAELGSEGALSKGCSKRAQLVWSLRQDLSCRLRKPVARQLSLSSQGGPTGQSASGGETKTENKY